MPEPQQQPATLDMKREISANELQELRGQVEKMPKAKLDALRGELQQYGQDQKEYLRSDVETQKAFLELRNTVEMAGNNPVHENEEPVEKEKAEDAKEPGEKKPRVYDGVIDRTNHYAENVTEFLAGKERTKNWSDGQKRTLGYAVTIGGVLLVASIVSGWFRGRYSEAAGQQAAANTKGSWFKKLLIGGAITVAAFFGIRWGIKALMKNLDEKTRKAIQDQIDKVIPKSVQDMVKNADKVIEGGEKGALRGAKQVQEIFGEAAEVVLNRKNMMEVIGKRETYKSNVEFMQTLLWAGAKDGVGFVWDGSKFCMDVRGRLIPLTTKFWGGVYDAISNGEISPNEAGELFGTYIEGVFVYATSLTALRVLTLNYVGRGLSLKGMAKESILWPVYVIKRGAQGAYMMTKCLLNLRETVEAKMLVAGRMKNAVRLGTEFRLRNLLGQTKDIESLLLRLDFAKNALEQLRAAKANTQLAEGLPRFQKNVNAALDNLHIALKGMDEADIPKDLLDAIRSVAPGVDIKKLSAQQLENALHMVDPDSIRGRLPKAATPPPAPEAPPTDAPKTNAPDVTPEAAQAAQSSDDVLDAKAWENALAKFNGGKVRPGDVEALLQLAEEAGAIKLDKATLALIRESPQAQKIISGAVETADVLEVSRALRAAKLGAALRGTANVVAIAGDAFGLYMAYADWHANGNRIAETNNPALKELYKNAYPVYAIEGGTSAIGLTVTGYCIVQSAMAGEGLLAAAGASGGLILLPVTAAAVAGGLYYRQLEGMTETWTKMEDDWMKEHPSALINKLEQLAPGKQGYFQGAAHETNAERIWHWVTMNAKDYEKFQEEGFKGIEGANGGTRFQITRALMRQLVSPAKRKGESDVDYRKRADAAVSDAVKFMGDMTENTFSLPFGMTAYRLAQQHAELMGISKELTANGGSQVLPMYAEDDAGKIFETDKTYDLKNYASMVQRSKHLTDSDAEGHNIMRVLYSYDRFKSAQVLSQVSVLSALRGPDGKKLDNAPLRAVLITKMLTDIRFDLIRFQQKMESADLVGWWITGAEGKAKAQVYEGVSQKLRETLRSQADAILNGKGDLSSYAYDIGTLQAILQTDPLQHQKEYTKITPSADADLHLIEAAWLAQYCE